MAQSPSCTALDEPKVTGIRPVLSTLITAMSLVASSPTMVAGAVLLSLNVTVIDCPELTAPSSVTTWSFVKM